MATQKSQGFFVCGNCDYNTFNKYDFNKHLLTRKHQKSLNTTHICDNIANTENKKKFGCKCGKAYMHKQSLYKHNKKCKFEEENIDEENIDEENNDAELALVKDGPVDYKSMFLKIINENSEMKSLLVEQQKQLGEQQKQIGELIPRIGNNTNNIKQKFNINVFLNEKCKDAISMSKFLDDIKVTLEDLFITKNKGITEGVSSLFIKNMNKLSLYERPIHCTDMKRETVYIKSECKDGETSTWEKDTEQEKLKRAISDMTFVQSKNLKLYTEQNPDWMEKEHKQTEYIMMMKNCMDDIKKDNRKEKVIRKICNNVYYNGEK
jgi:hypothetical protein